jgi:hypothetical protein
MAVTDAKVDMIHFDNTSMQAESAIFQYPLAIKLVSRIRSFKNASILGNTLSW